MRCVLLCAALGAPLVTSPFAVADEPLFGQYWLTGNTLTRPSAEAFSVLPDGRVVAINDATVYVESSAGSRSFASIGSISGLTSTDAAFIKASPDGTRIAVGNNGGPTYSDYKIGFYSLADFTGGSVSGSVFNQNHYEATWSDNDTLVVADGGKITQLTVGTGVTKTLVSIPGASGGVAFDSSGALYAGIGYDFNPADGDQTGQIRRFSASALAGAGGGGLDFVTAGTLVADLLSASNLAFDTDGNLIVAGGDYFGSSGDFGYIGIVNADALAAVIGGSQGAVDLNAASTDLQKINTFDSGAIYNPVLDEIYTSSYGSTSSGIIAIPEPATLGLFATALLAMRRRRA